MARLDAEMLDQILTTLREYAEKNLPVATLLEIEIGHDFPEKVMKDLYDPGQIGLHLLTSCSSSSTSPTTTRRREGACARWPTSTRRSSTAR
jgi:hypothetical protein